MSLAVIRAPTYLPSNSLSKRSCERESLESPPGVKPVIFGVIVTEWSSPTTTAMRPFDTATLLEVLPDGSFRGHTSPAHANMVGPFGGVTAACLLQAPMQHTARLAEPVALTVNFAAALVDGEFVITARPLRTNRLTQHWSMELTQGGEIAASATSVFAVRRETWSTPEAAPPANLPTPDTLTRAPLIGRPTWTRHYDMRFARGPRGPRFDVRCAMSEAFDEQPQLDSVSQLWVRDEPPRPLDFPALASLCDSFFPRISSCVVARSHRSARSRSPPISMQMRLCCRRRWHAMCSASLGRSISATATLTRASKCGATTGSCSPAATGSSTTASERSSRHRRTRSFAGRRTRRCEAAPSSDQPRRTSSASVCRSLAASIGLVRKASIPASSASSRSETSAAAVSARIGRFDRG